MQPTIIVFIEPELLFVVGVRLDVDERSYLDYPLTLVLEQMAVILKGTLCEPSVADREILFFSRHRYSHARHAPMHLLTLILTLKHFRIHTDTHVYKITHRDSLAMNCTAMLKQHYQL